jgi:hypothetical protein
MFILYQKTKCKEGKSFIKLLQLIKKKKWHSGYVYHFYIIIIILLFYCSK